MGRIQTDTGLISGIPIADTVDKLMAIAARPRDLLKTRNETLQKQQAAVTELAALLLSVQYVAKNLGEPELYVQRTASSSDPAALAATVTGNPAPGTYQFTPLRVVQSQQLISAGRSSDTDPLGAGSVRFRFGDDLERSARLDLIGGGQGFSRGKIRITDRSGASAEIDLTAAQTIDEVLEAINGNSTINVTATAAGDRIRLTDHTGQTLSNLRVQEVSGGSTAASLALAGIDVAADVADGQDLLRLADALRLDALNDGRGVRINTVLADIEYKLSDGTTGTIDLSPLVPGGSQVDQDVTLGDVLERINAAAPGKLKAEIPADGERLVVTDLTQGENAFELNSLYESSALADLGLDVPAAGNAISGRRILGGARTVLLGSLNGGRGFGQLGLLSLTDRSGATATVDLSAAETLEEVLDAIHGAGLGITARVDRAGMGIEIVDTTGASAGNLVVASGDGNQTAEKLGIAVNDAVALRRSGDLHLQVVGDNTRLADLNGGAGVARGTLTIQDTAGRRATLDLSGDGVRTIGDVIRAIHRLNLSVRAEINETGDGIRLLDTAGGSGTLAVTEGSSTAAKDLHLLGGAKTVDVGGQPAQVIDGATTYAIQLDADDSLADLRQKINELDAGVSAAIVFDGSNAPYRLSLTSNRPGRLGEIRFDSADLGIAMQETVRAQDALLLYGSDPAYGILVSSSTNNFNDALPGITLQAKQATGMPVTVTVETTDTNLVASVKTMVENYNKFRKRLGELTEYDSETDTRSVLTGDRAALRMDGDLSYLLSGTFGSGGAFSALGQIGISLKSDGTLEFDESEFRAAYAESPDAVKDFLSKEEVGVSARITGLIEQMAGVEGSLITNRTQAIDEKVTSNQERIDSMTERLDAERERLLLEFYRLETTIAKLQASLSALTNIQSVPSILTWGQSD